MAKFFFAASHDAADQIESLFNFVWPTAVALWNLRQQVQGFVASNANTPDTQLTQHFIAGSDIQGADLRRACIEQTWSEQQERLAGIILTNTFAVYEHWAEEIMTACGKVARSGEHLQGNEIRRANGTIARLGIKGVIADFAASPSNSMTLAYYPIAIRAKKFSLPIIDNLANCYWYFKEIRNCMMHGGGVASSRAELAYAAFAQNSGKSSLGMRGELKHYPITAGQPVRVDLRGVVGFTEVILKIITTVDAELCRSSAGEAYFLKRSMNPVTVQPSNISSNPKRRGDQVSKRCIACGFVRPKEPLEIYRLLRQHNIISA